MRESGAITKRNDFKPCAKAREQEVDLLLIV